MPGDPRARRAGGAMNLAVVAHSRTRSRAHDAVQAAIAAGRLPAAGTLSCADCGAPARVYHHHKGYAPPAWLDVVAVCDRCHSQRHWLRWHPDRYRLTRARARRDEALLLTVAASARLLGLPETTLRRMIARGAIPAAAVVRFPAGSGGWLRLKRRVLLAWAGGSAQAAEAPGGR